MSNYAIYFCSFLATALINPGIAERKYYQGNYKNKILEKNKWLYCTKCNIIFPKELRITHCTECNICIKNIDHHCPWTGKCIAKKNIKYFYTFVLSLFIYFFNIFVTFTGHMKYMQTYKKK